MSAAPTEQDLLTEWISVVLERAIQKVHEGRIQRLLQRKVQFTTSSLRGLHEDRARTILSQLRKGVDYHLFVSFVTKFTMTNNRGREKEILDQLLLDPQNIDFT